MNLKRLLRNILLLPVLIVFASQKKDPELLEIPGAEGLSVDYFANLMTATAPQLQVGAAQQIPLQQIAGLGVHEQTVQDLLGKYIGTPATDTEGYKLGMDEIKKTLGGEFYDPKTSDFWKGFREQSAMEQEEGTEDIRRRGQLGGGLFATGVAREEVKYQAGKEAERTRMLGGLFEKERDRRTNAVGQALGYAGFEEQGAANRIGLGSTVGAIPRQVENQRLQAIFNQAMGQSTADYAQQEKRDMSKYQQEIMTLATQTGAAEQLMPQWNVDQGSDSGGFWAFLANLLSPW